MFAMSCTLVSHQNLEVGFRKHLAVKLRFDQSRALDALERELGEKHDFRGVSSSGTQERAGLTSSGQGGSFP